MLFRVNVNDTPRSFLFHFDSFNRFSSSEKQDKIRSRLYFFKKKRKKKELNVSCSFLLSFHPVENSLWKKQEQSCQKDEKKRKKKKGMKKKKKKK